MRERASLRPILRQKDRKVSEDKSNTRLREALADCAAGRHAGVAAILEHEGPKLLGLAYRILGRHDLAEEALQDAMVQVWRKATQFDAAHGSARGWIYAILRNRCLNTLRDGKRLSILSPSDLAEVQERRQAVVPTEGWEILAGPSRIRDCLKTLDGQSRHIILLAHVAGFSHAEISARQDVPLGTIKSLIRRGLHALKECLT
ncbi:RNA polymerase subunit sigma [Celeribacter baekdonensis]|uniref:RNA polymerase subunit sigma n=1 Tax=Celeribacter baekdonensis TaxID=875171 RepID=A0A2R4M872_9RHOB|nr:RNA polymerase subunit sigma [Celeribacter baekdonensis]